ncbi:Integral membrane protein [Pseudozyma hubeiensis]|nr:Integral membrane protein [Pseudozyma hubeiensis]
MSSPTYKPINTRNYARHLCYNFGLVMIHVGEFLTFAAVVLAVFANIGQLSNNIVTRNIRYVSVDTSGLGDALSRNGLAVGDLYASSQSSPVGQGNGLKEDYQWGLYNYCAGQESGSQRSCSQRNFGFEFLPVDAILADAPQDARQQIQNFLPASTFRDSKYLGDFSKPAMYLIFIGSCLALVAWIAGLLSHRFAFLGAAFIALLSALALGVGAALLTAIYVKAKASVNNAQYGVVVHYGNALWITWAAFAAVALSIVPYIISCCTGRDDDY